MQDLSLTFGLEIQDLWLWTVINYAAKEPFLSLSFLILRIPDLIFHIGTAKISAYLLQFLIHTVRKSRNMNRAK